MELSSIQLEHFSVILANIGLVFFASMVAPFLLAPAVDIKLAIWGGWLAIFFWSWSLSLLKKVGK